MSACLCVSVSVRGSVVASVCNRVQLCRATSCMMLMSYQVSQSALQCWQQLSCSEIHLILTLNTLSTEDKVAIRTLLQKYRLMMSSH